MHTCAFNPSTTCSFVSEDMTAGSVLECAGPARGVSSSSFLEERRDCVEVLRIFGEESHKCVWKRERIVKCLAEDHGLRKATGKTRLIVVHYEFISFHMPPNPYKRVLKCIISKTVVPILGWVKSAIDLPVER